MKYQRTNKQFVLFFALKIMQEINERYNELYSQYIFDKSLIEQFNELTESSNVNLSSTELSVILCAHNNSQADGVLFFQTDKDGWSIKFINSLDILVWCSEFTVACDTTGGIIGLDAEVSAICMKDILMEFTTYIYDCNILYYKCPKSIFIDMQIPTSIDNDKDNLIMRTTEAFLSETSSAKYEVYEYYNDMSDKIVYHIPPRDIRIMSIGGLYRFCASGPIHFSEPRSENNLLCFKEFKWLYIYYSNYKLLYYDDSFVMKGHNIETTFYYRIKGDFYDSFVGNGNFLLALKSDNLISVYDHNKKVILSDLSECHFIEEGAILYRNKKDNYLELLPPKDVDVAANFNEAIGLNFADLQTKKACIKISQYAVILQIGEGRYDFKIIGSHSTHCNVQLLKVKLSQKESSLFIINGSYIITDENYRICPSVSDFYLYNELYPSESHITYLPDFRLEAVYYNKNSMSIMFVFSFYRIELDRNYNSFESLCCYFITNFEGQNIYETDDSKNIIEELQKLGFTYSDKIYPPF